MITSLLINRAEKFLPGTGRWQPLQRLTEGSKDCALANNPQAFHDPGAPPFQQDLGRARHRTVGASEVTVRMAHKLRREMTLPEVLLWQALRGKPRGLKFRRQFPVLGYIADLACTEVRLLVEIDGIAHDMDGRPARDEKRDALLTDRGWRVLRLAAKDVLVDVAGTAASIVALAESLRPLHRPALPDGPPPRSGEDFA